MIIKNLDSELNLGNENSKREQNEKGNERVERRGVNSKTFSKQKGVFETVYYHGPIHYGADGDMREINNRLSQGEQLISNEEHNFMIRFNGSGVGKALFELTKKDYCVRVSAKYPFGQKKRGMVPILKEDNCELFYENIVSNIDYHYTITCDGVKGSATLKDMKSTDQCAFCLSAEHMTVWWDGNRKISFVSDDEKTPVFVLPEAFMTDARGDSSDKVEYEVIYEDDRNIEVTLLPDRHWLNDPNREFPIEVSWNIKEHKSFCGLNFNNVTKESVVIDGHSAEFLMKLPKAEDGERMRKIDLLVHLKSVPVAEEKEYLLCLKKRGNTMDTEGEEKLIGVQALNAETSEYSFDVTGEYNKEQGASYSLQLCETVDEEIVPTDDAAVAVMSLSSDTAVYSVRTTTAESEDEESSGGETGNIGSVGTYRVDTKTGSLCFELKDFAWDGNRMPISINHVFDGRYITKQFADWNSKNSVFSNMKIGNGWRLNLMQSMKLVGEKYIYTDDSYEERTFKKSDDTSTSTSTGTYALTRCIGDDSTSGDCSDGCTGGSTGSGDCSDGCTDGCTDGCCCGCDEAVGAVYVDEKNMGYTYYEKTGILEKGDQTLYFENGRLVKIKDQYGNTMRIQYSTAGQISTVSDGVGREFKFAYENNLLKSITAPNKSAIKYYYYEGNSNYLEEIEYPNGQVLTFTKFQRQEIVERGIEIRGEIKQQRLGFTTDFKSGLMSIKRYYKTVQEDDWTDSGYTTSFKYTTSEKQTLVKEEDGKGSKKIVRYNVYYHDNPELNYTYYDSTGEENKLPLTRTEGEFLPYTDPGMDLGGLYCRNLLRNTNFNRTQDFALQTWGWNTNLPTWDTASISTAPSDSMPGFIAAEIRNSNRSDQLVGIWQEPTLEIGDYIFSCYLKPITNARGTDAGVYLAVIYCDGTVKKGPKLNIRSEEFVRAVLPFSMKKRECCRVGIYIDGAITFKAIAPQLEKGKNEISPYNYLSNVEDFLLPSVKNDTYETKVATLVVNCLNDTKETFTFSAKVTGGMYCASSEHIPEAALRADIYYYGREKKGEGEPHRIPIYLAPDEPMFVKLQFSKDEYDAVQRIELYCENNYNHYEITFTELQLVRNSIESGLSESEFYESVNTTKTTDTDTDTEETATEETVSMEEEVESIIFNEYLDRYGNPLTGTQFKNGEFGAIYTAFEYADSDKYDPLGDEGNNKTEEMDARGNVTRYEYDPILSKPTKVTDRCGHETHYEYDETGRTVKVTDANGGSVEYGYTVYDDLASIARGDGQTYTMEYDAFRNLKTVRVGEEVSLAEYTYREGTNRLKSVTYANGSVQELVYDARGNVKSEIWTKGDETEAEYRYFYDGSQNLVKTLDIVNKKMYNINRVGENIVSTEEYDVESFEENASLGVTPVGTFHYSFDKDGKQFRKKYVDANGKEQKYVFEYQDEQNVAVQLPTGVVSHAKSDHLGRKVFNELQIGKGLMNRRFSYYDGEITQNHIDGDKQVSKPETTLVKQIDYADGRTVQYEYDNEERITKVIDSVDGTTEYTYDDLGQLLTERVNGELVNSMEYDNYGNILKKNDKTYTYGNETWQDLLTSYNGQTITYDAQRTPTSYLGHTLTWEKGRQLKSFDGNTYTYNKDGIRTSKTVNGVLHTYTLDGTNIVKETWGTNTLIPLYDLDGTVCGLNYNGKAYYFYKNLQGDVIAITDNTGATIARYTYDAWGKVLTVTDKNGIDLIGAETHIANINPFRYRGYYYDQEIALYYLQSRYYNPEIGRFINADDVVYLSKSGTILGCNLFSYCENNSVCRVDTIGSFWLSLILGCVSLVYLGNNLVHSVYNQSKSPRGFIYDQEDKEIGKLRFGFFKSSFNGCGWIATYNALILLGKTPKAEDIISEYELTGAVLGGVFGVYPFAVSNYFRARGYKVKTTYNAKNVDKVAKKHTANILFYWHSSGAHYFATHWDGKQFIGYNVLGGKKSELLGDSLSKKFHNNQKRRIGVLISISKK